MFRTTQRLAFALGCLLLLNGGMPNSGFAVEERQPFVLMGSVSQDVYQDDTYAEPGIVGLDMEIRPKGFPLVKKVFRDTPAQLVGMRTGDIILAVNGQSVQNKSRAEVDEAISDVPGTPIMFTVRREGKTRNIQLRVVSLSEISAGVRAEFTPHLSNRPNEN